MIKDKQSRFKLENSGRYLDGSFSLISFDLYSGYNSSLNSGEDVPYPQPSSDSLFWQNYQEKLTVADKKEIAEYQIKLWQSFLANLENI